MLWRVGSFGRLLDAPSVHILTRAIECPIECHTVPECAIECHIADSAIVPWSHSAMEPGCNACVQLGRISTSKAAMSTCLQNCKHKQCSKNCAEAMARFAKSTHACKHLAMQLYHSNNSRRKLKTRQQVVHNSFVFTLLLRSAALAQ